VAADDWRPIFPGSLNLERQGKALATATTDRALIEAIVAEMSDGIEDAVSFWMTQIQKALHDPRLTTLGRMNAVQAIVERYNSGNTPGSGHDGYAA
jgi:hypothetical protein